MKKKMNNDTRRMWDYLEGDNILTEAIVGNDSEPERYIPLKTSPLRSQMRKTGKLLRMCDNVEWPKISLRGCRDCTRTKETTLRIMLKKKCPTKEEEY